jgi:hypothetical protein
MDADVIVVGARLAGLVATHELTSRGKKVALVDQENAANLGGQAFWSFGGIFLVDSPEQRRMRVKDSFELAWNDWQGSAGFDRLIAAEVLTVGSEALPDIESKLRSLDVYSAWQRLPDAQVGIVHVNSDHHFEKVLALVSRMAAGRVGVSARFDDLRDTPQALHCAKVTLRGRADRTSQVAVFDGSILATAAISAPEVMVKSVGTALDGFSELPDEQRRILFDTFRVWQENDASVNAVAERLTCHPNTVRHRRIEKYTGRSLSRPRDVAELCLAFEVHRRLFEPKPRGCENDRCPPVWCGDVFMERHRVSNPIKQMGDKRGKK